MLRKAVLFLFCLLALSCFGPGKKVPGVPADTFSNPIYPSGSSPHLVRYGGHYYYTQSMNDHVSLWKADRIAEIREAQEHVIYSPAGVYHVSAPQMHRIDGKWYVLYSSDDGSGSDIRHIYVLENPAEDPLDGTFSLKGWIRTGNAKDIHPTTFTHRGRRYLLWSGTPAVSRGGTSVWSIYIAAMANPWTLESAPQVISSPQYEWECQWIDEDGTSSPTPIHINEGPEFLYSRDSTRLLVYYAASETYSSYYCEGLLDASSDADPLDPSSWYKNPEPVFSSCERTGVIGPGHISFFRTSDQLFILYNGKSRLPLMRAVDNRSPRMQEIRWGKDGIPVLGHPVRVDSVLLSPRTDD